MEEQPEKVNRYWIYVHPDDVDLTDDDIDRLTLGTQENDLNGLYEILRCPPEIFQLWRQMLGSVLHAKGIDNSKLDPKEFWHRGIFFFVKKQELEKK